MNANKYKSFVKMDYPKKFDYSIENLEGDGFKFRGRFNKTNPDFKQLCDHIKNQGRVLKIIELEEKNKVDIWVKK